MEVTRIPTDPSTILLSLQDRLQAKVFAESTVLICVNEDKVPQIPPSTIRALIVPGDLQPNNEQSGGGRANTVVEWPLEIVIQSEVVLDPGNTDSAALTNASIGLYSLLAKTIDAVQMHELLDGQGRGLLTKPIRLGTCRRPTRPAMCGELRQTILLSFVFSCPTPSVF